MNQQTISEHDIREHAFYLWQQAGSPENAQNEFWHRAREALEKSSAQPNDDLVEETGGHYPPPTGDTQNFA